MNRRKKFYVFVGAFLVLAPVGTFWLWHHYDYYIPERIYFAFRPEKGRSFNNLRHSIVGTIERLETAKFDRRDRRSRREMVLEDHEWRYIFTDGDKWPPQDGKLWFDDDEQVRFEPSIEGFGDTGSTRVTYERASEDTVIFVWKEKKLTSEILVSPWGGYGNDFHLYYEFDGKRLNIKNKWWD